MSSGHPREGTQEKAFDSGGASSTRSGNAAAYNFRRAGEPLINYVRYHVRFSISTDGSAFELLETYEWQPRPDEQRVESFFPLVDSGKETFSHFKVQVYSDQYFEQLIFEADSSASTDNWTIRDQPIFERIFYMLERDTCDQAALIRDLPLLYNADRTDPLYLIYLAYLVGGGDNFPASLSTFRRREFVKNLVDIWKIKGTFHSWRLMGQLRNLGTINIRELYKEDIHEDCDYSAIKDDRFQLKSARIDVMSCDTQCENFAEFALASGESFTGTNLTVGRAIEIIEGELNDIRPVHVLVRRLCKQQVITDEWRRSEDSVAGSVIRALLTDDFIVTTDALTVIQSCVSTCETDCQTCDQGLCTEHNKRGTDWKYKIYKDDPGSVSSELAAFYATGFGGGGFVTGAAPVDEYYKFSFDDSDFSEGVSPFIDPVDIDSGPSSKVFIPHSEIVLRKTIRLPAFVTGAHVTIGYEVNDILEIFWNETMVGVGGIGRDLSGATAGRYPAGSAPQLIDGPGFDGTWTPTNSEDFVFFEIPSSLLRVGDNIIAVRAADHFGSLNLVSLRINVDCDEAADKAFEVTPPTEFTF